MALAVPILKHFRVFGNYVILAILAVKTRSAKI